MRRRGEESSPPLRSRAVPVPTLMKKTSLHCKEPGAKKSCLSSDIFFMGRETFETLVSNNGDVTGDNQDKWDIKSSLGILTL